MHPETIRWKGKLNAMYLRHEELVEEMTHRGYNHKSPLDKRKATGKHPMSMAAAAVYLAVQDNHEKVSQTKIAQISGISAVTIRNRVKELEIAQVR